MKHILLFLVLFQCINIQAQSTTSDFTLAGKIKGLTDQKVYIVYFSGNARVRDSASVKDFKFNFKDSSAIGIAENSFYQCERNLFTSNLKTGISNTFNGGNSLRITSSYYGNTPNTVRLMISGVSEQEIDLSTLSEKTNHFLVNSPNDNLALSAKWENGYVSVFKENLNQYKLKVFEFENNKSNLIYTQTIQLKPNEILAAIEAKKKWYITTQNNQPNNV